MSRCMVSYRGTNSYRWQRSASVLHAITRLEDFRTAPVDGTHLYPRSSRDARELLDGRDVFTHPFLLCCPLSTPIARQERGSKVQQGPSCPIFYCFTSHRTIRKPVSLVSCPLASGTLLEPALRLGRSRHSAPGYLPLHDSSWRQGHNHELSLFGTGLGGFSVRLRPGPEPAHGQVLAGCPASWGPKEVVPAAKDLGNDGGASCAHGESVILSLCRCKIT